MTLVPTFSVIILALQLLLFRQLTSNNVSGPLSCPPFWGPLVAIFDFGGGAYFRHIASAPFTARLVFSTYFFLLPRLLFSKRECLNKKNSLSKNWQNLPKTLSIPCAPRQPFWISQAVQRWRQWASAPAPLSWNFSYWPLLYFYLLSSEWST